MVSLASTSDVFPLGKEHYWKWGGAFLPYFLLALFPRVLGSLAVKLNFPRGNYSLWAVRYAKDLCRHITVIHDSRPCITFHCSYLQASVGNNLRGSSHSKLTGREISPQEWDKGISFGTLARMLDKLGTRRALPFFSLLMPPVPFYSPQASLLDHAKAGPMTGILCTEGLTPLVPNSSWKQSY